MKSQYYTQEAAVRLEPPTSILIHGSFGIGKTPSICSASKYYPPLPKQAPFSSLVELKDFGFILWDKQGLQSLPKLGLTARSLPLAGLNPAYLLDALADVHQDVIEWVKDGVDKIGFDTLTGFDIKAQLYCQKSFDVKGSPGKPAGDTEGQDTASQTVYRALLEIYKNEFQWFTSLKTPDGRPVTMFWLAHTDVKGEIRVNAKSKPEQFRKAMQVNRSMGLPENNPQLAAAITGKAWKLFHNDSPLVMNLDAKVGDGGRIERVFYTNNKLKNVMARDKAGVLADEEPADFRVILPKYKQG